MRNILLLALLLLIPGDGNGIGIQQMTSLITPAAAGGAPSFIFDENCEGTGTPSGWTDTGAPDWDSTTVILAGSESVEMIGAATPPRVHYDFTPAVDTIYVRFRMHRTAGTGYRVLSLRNQTGDTEPAFVNIAASPSGGFTIQHGTSAATTVNGSSIGTDYNIWVRYTKSSGANDGVMTLGFSTTSTEPTSGDDFVSVTTGTQTSQINRVQFRNGSSSGSNTIFHDDMTGDDVSIGDF